MPEHAAEQRERAADQRYFTIAHDQVSFAGTSRVHGELDLADALDLEDAVAAGAHQLLELGSTETLDARRAAAVGLLARGEQALDLQPRSVAKKGFEARSATPGVPEEQATSLGGRTSTTVGPDRHRREIVLYAHLSEDALRSHDPDAPVWVENAGGQLLTAAQVAQWCGRPDTSRVTVKRVVDLHAHLAVDAYEVPAQIAEHVRLRRTCVFPWCQRPARCCDLDHIEPYVPMDEGGPPGQTNTRNLAPLCRLHHRMKTHGGWTYSMLDLGEYLWRSPHGHTWHRDRTGTTDLTPPPVEPPER
jgi:hypothetical protein